MYRIPDRSLRSHDSMMKQTFSNKNNKIRNNRVRMCCFILTTQLLSTRHVRGFFVVGRHMHSLSLLSNILLPPNPYPLRCTTKESARWNSYSNINIDAMSSFKSTRQFSTKSEDGMSHDGEDIEMQRLIFIREELINLGYSIQTFDRLCTAADDYTIQQQGFDSYFGKSAIKVFRTYLYPKKESNERVKSTGKLIITAKRTATQIDFLSRRHQSREAENIRCVDDEQKQRHNFPIAIVLDNLRSAANVGSIFRSADAAGCSEVVTIGYTPRPNGSGSEKVAKSALGAELVVPSKHFSNIKEAISYLRESGYTQIVGMETFEGSIPYTDVVYSQVGKGTAIVLGNEVTGISAETIPYFDNMVEIPMFGAKNSLNVAACAPVVLYEILRQWNYNT